MKDEVPSGLRVLIAGGGTGGHVFPALAVAEQLCLEDNAARVLFVGGGGMEMRAVRAAGYEIVALKVGRIKGTALIGRARTLAGLPLAVARAASIMRQFDPQVVVGAGGYVSAPITIAAAISRVPVVLLEQNAIPGLTNRSLARFADRVVISYAEAASRLPAGKAVLLGNPVRPTVVRDLPLGLRAINVATPHLLVLGGSQGARRINEIVTEAMPKIVGRMPGLRVTHQTGAADASWVRERYAAAGIGARVEPFIEQMGPLYREASFVISRAGATTLAELALAGLPALLIPYPHAADDHQRANAQHLADAGAADVVEQDQLTPTGLARRLLGVLADGAQLEGMARAMRAEGHADAAQQVVALLRELATS